MKSKLKFIQLEMIAFVATCPILNSQGQQPAVTRFSGEIKETNDRVCTLSLARSRKP
jgi:hypothetical protein